MLPKESLVFQSDIYLERPPATKGGAGCSRQATPSQGEMRITENYNSLTMTVPAGQRTAHHPSNPSLAKKQKLTEAGHHRAGATDGQEEQLRQPSHVEADQPGAGAGSE